VAVRARRTFPSSLTSRWSIVLAALAGAWLGHLIEYIRVAGWHAGMVDMTSTVHEYYFPAGAGLVGLTVLAGSLAARGWTILRHRLQRAQTGLWTRPGHLPAAAEVPGRPLGLGGTWAVLAALQLAIWVVQENLEAMAAGHAAPMLSVVAGTHSLAPVIQAEVALMVAAGLVVVRRSFHSQRTRIEVIERLVRRKWSRIAPSPPVLTPSRRVPCTPAERWGVHRWQRPPPTGAIAA
jgi:hypothetical protein